MFFYDLSILELKKELHLNLDLVWNNTHMVTNYYTSNYYYDKGCKYSYLSNEITIDEIIEFKKKAKAKLIFMLLGYPVVSFSKRKLLTNSNFEKELKIKEPISKQEYKVIESKFGTTFKYNKVRNNASCLKECTPETTFFQTLHISFASEAPMFATCNIMSAAEIILSFIPFTAFYFIHFCCVMHIPFVRFTR